MKYCTPAIALSFVAAPALAHVSPAAHGSFATGLAHPLFGLDHMLAMLAIGLWARFIGGQTVWKLPLAFVAAMVLGFGLALGGIQLPFVEPMILASTILLGCSIAAALRPDLWKTVAIVVGFGLVHGHAHGSESGNADALRFMLGFVTATSALHALGLFAGAALAKSRWLNRAVGGAIAVSGLMLAFA